MSGEEYRFAGKAEIDVDEDGDNETVLKGFIHKTDSNKSIMMYTTDGKLWGWGVLGDFQNVDNPTNHNYMLSDYDGRPGYDRLFDAIEDFPLPERFED